MAMAGHVLDMKADRHLALPTSIRELGMNDKAMMILSAIFLSSFSVAPCPCFGSFHCVSLPPQIAL